MVRQAISSTVAYARDTFLHVCAAIARILHLNKLVSIGSSFRSSRNALEAPSSTVTIETLSPDAFLCATSKQTAPSATAKPDDEANQAATTIERVFRGHLDRSRLDDDTHGATPKHSDAEMTEFKSSETKLPFGVAYAAPINHDSTDVDETESKHTDAGSTESKHIDAGTAGSKRIDATPMKQSTPAIQSAFTEHGTGKDDVAAATTPATHETLADAKHAPLKRKDSERDVLEAASAATPTNLASASTKRAGSGESEDLDQVSTESNATEDAEEDQSFASDDSKRAIKRDTPKSATVPKTSTKRGGAREDKNAATSQKRREYALPNYDSISSDDEDALKSDLYQQSPRCMPTMTSATFMTF